MIILTRRVDIHDGKIREAFAWAVKVAHYVNEKFPGVKLQTTRNVGGPGYQICWFASYDSLAAYEKAWKELEADAGYQALIGEIRQQGALIGTSLVDSLHDVIS